MRILHVKEFIYWRDRVLKIDKRFIGNLETDLLKSVVKTVYPGEVFEPFDIDALLNNEPNEPFAPGKLLFDKEEDKNL